MKARGRRLASVHDVARSVVRAIDRGQPVLYAAQKWQLIMLVVHHLPAAIFNRLAI
jgi:hypothetical protein